MQQHQARFVAGAAELSRLPQFDHPQVAFAGRSNVGKSSLINRLVGRHALARVSKTPGRTQQINFFAVDEQLVFTDLPGYGFARVPLPVKEQWKHLIEGYLTSKQAPRCVVVIIDLRRGLQTDDELLLDFLAAHAIEAIVVATKVDRVKWGERKRLAGAVEAAVGERGQVLCCSSVSGEGIAELWNEIRRRCGV